MINKAMIFLIIITSSIQNICIAGQNQDIFQYKSAQEIIKFLNESKYDRESLSIRNSNIGRKAPVIYVEEWLKNEPSINKWPNGQITIIEFWDITCGPCIASVPKNNKISELITSKGGSFISIHKANEDKAKIIEFLEEKQIKYTVAIDTNSVQKPYWGKTFCEYGVDALPTYVTIGKEGDVLSYKDLEIQDINNIFNNEEDYIDFPQDSSEIWTLVSTPKAWIDENLDPRSKISKNIFVYRPDTPELTLQNVEPIDTTVTLEFVKHTAQKQTVYEVFLYSNAPDWEKTIKGDITILGKYETGVSILTIPYQLKSKGLVEFSSSTIHLGIVNKGQIVTREIIFIPTNKNDIRIKPILLPENIKCEVENKVISLNDCIIVSLTMSFEEIGLIQDIVKLLVFDNKDNNQNIDLKLSALVR